MRVPTAHLQGDQRQRRLKHRHRQHHRRPVAIAAPGPPTVLIDSPATGVQATRGSQDQVHLPQTCKGLRESSRAPTRTALRAAAEGSTPPAPEHTDTPSPRPARTASAPLQRSAIRSDGASWMYPEVTVPAKLINAAQPCVLLPVRRTRRSTWRFLRQLRPGHQQHRPLRRVRQPATCPCAPMDLVHAAQRRWRRTNGFLLNPNWAWYEHYNPQWSQFRPWSYGNVRGRMRNSLTSPARASRMT